MRAVQVGDCSVIYLAKEGSEASYGLGTPWMAELLLGGSVSLGDHSQIVISYDESNVVSVHTHAAWGLGGNLRRPVLLDSITSMQYALSFVHGRSWACPDTACWVGVSVCGRYGDYAEVVTSMSTIGVVDAETIALDACSAFQSPAMPPFSPGMAPVAPPPNPPATPTRTESASASFSSSLPHTATAEEVEQARATAVARATEHSETVAGLQWVAPADETSLESQKGVGHIYCTFVATICEDHFDTGQHFRYGACSVDGNASTHAFGERVVHVVNMHAV